MTEQSDNSLLARIDLVCDRFEQAWLADDAAEPNLEDFLDDWSGPERGVLFEHLLELDVDYRRRRNLTCSAEHYRRRFPEYRAAIEDANLDATYSPPQSSVLPPLKKEIPPGKLPQTDADIPDTQSWGWKESNRGRFAPGTLVARRYRIVDLLGRGGMGEVYQADDVKLGHPVALKFLPAEIAQDADRLDYFLNEAKLSRQISHPNVCRVYDIGEVSGTVFLSMEFIDGEDLRGLLERFGRLPPEKATQLALQMCAGLAAAHDVGVLHRDLKPANVMIDRRGRAKIADFGVARLADDRDATGRMVGTPAYMAPEQLLHNRTSPQSDIYSLGLVLYEMFTGNRPYRADSIGDLIEQQSKGPPPEARTVVPELDTGVSDAISACLARLPESRPKSALELARRLPGADPLALELAAGHTPSPEELAVAGKDRILSTQAALACFVGTLVAVLVTLILATRMMHNLGFDESPQVLASRARDHLGELGYAARPRDESWGFGIDRDYRNYFREHPDHWADSQNSGPPTIYFWYRQSPAPLVPRRPDWTGEYFLNVDQQRPPLTEPGMVRLRTDMQGRLWQLEAIAPASEPAIETEKEAEAETDPAEPAQEPDNTAGDNIAGDNVDWNELLDWAELEKQVNQQELAPTPADFVPPSYANQLAAWTGKGIFSAWPEESGTVEAAAMNGTPVMFQTIGPWNKEAQAKAAKMTGEHPVRALIVLVWLPSLLIVAFLLAIRNLRKGRGDLRGTLRLATFVFAIGMLSWLLRDTHVSSTAELDLLFTALAGSMLLAATLGTSYLALEVYLRRLWPESILGWSRLLSGRIYDAAVGRELAVGMLVGAVVAVFKLIIILAPAPEGLPSDAPAILNLNTLLGTRVAMGEVAATACLALTYAMFNQLILLFIMRLVLRDMRLAALGFVAFMTFYVSIQFRAWEVAAVLTALEMSLMVLLFVRFGLLSAIAMHFMRMMLKWPLTIDLSTWYADIGLFALVATVGLAGWAFWMALDGRSLTPASDSVLSSKPA